AGVRISGNAATQPPAHSPDPCRYQCACRHRRHRRACQKLMSTGRERTDGVERDGRETVLIQMRLDLAPPMPPVTTDTTGPEKTALLARADGYAALPPKWVILGINNVCN